MPPLSVKTFSENATSGKRCLGQVHPTNSPSCEHETSSGRGKHLAAWRTSPVASRAAGQLEPVSEKQIGSGGRHAVIHGWFSLPKFPIHQDVATHGWFSVENSPPIRMSRHTVGCLSKIPHPSGCRDTRLALRPHFSRARARSTAGGQAARRPAAVRYGVRKTPGALPRQTPVPCFGNRPSTSNVFVDAETRRRDRHVAACDFDPPKALFLGFEVGRSS